MFSGQEKIMDPTFQPKRSGMFMVLEKYPCGSHSGGRGSVYYLCRCDCGKEFIVGVDELSKHPYSCGCTPKPRKGKTRANDWALGYDKDKHTMTCMLKPTRHVYASNKSGVSGVYWSKSRKHWEVEITVSQKRHYLGSYKSKEDAIKARIEGEKKYYDPMLEKSKSGN